MTAQIWLWIALSGLGIGAAGWMIRGWQTSGRELRLKRDYEKRLCLVEEDAKRLLRQAREVHAEDCRRLTEERDALRNRVAELDAPAGFEAPSKLDAPAGFEAPSKLDAQSETGAPVQPAVAQTNGAKPASPPPVTRPRRPKRASPEPSAAMKHGMHGFPDIYPMNGGNAAS